MVGQVAAKHTGQFSRRRLLRPNNELLSTRQIMLMASGDQNKNGKTDKLHFYIRSECMRKSGLVVTKQTGSPKRLHRRTLQHQGPIHTLDPRPVNRV
jgi:hypothetical protein